MLDKIKDFAKDFLEKTEKKNILVVSHFDTDGITSAAIFGRCLKKLDSKFSFKIIKSLDKEFIDTLPKDKIIVFLDLASANLKDLSQLPNQIFIIDHHEINSEEITPNIQVINSHLYAEGEEMSSSCLVYLITREMGKKDSEMANLAIIGMVGDLMETKAGPLVTSIFKDADLTIKKGILLYPSTRPLNKALEYCSNPYIPGVTGNQFGALDLLREAQIEFKKRL